MGDEDQRTGFGTMVYPDGAEFSGIWENGVHKEFRESRDSPPPTTTIRTTTAAAAAATTPPPITTTEEPEATTKRRRRRKKKIVKKIVKGKRVRGKPGAKGGKRRRKQ